MGYVLVLETYSGVRDYRGLSFKIPAAWWIPFQRERGSPRMRETNRLGKRNRRVARPWTIIVSNIVKTCYYSDSIILMNNFAKGLPIKRMISVLTMSPTAPSSGQSRDRKRRGKDLMSVKCTDSSENVIIIDNIELSLIVIQRIT